ncbi:MAG TPA: isoprenylcysteine carboxylmethyltransferase family protein [Propionicimonas sp.]
MPFVQHEAWAMLVFELSVAAFAVGELLQAVKWRRAASAVDLRGEIVYRLVLFAAILVLPLGLRLAPVGVMQGPAIFVVGAIIGWSGLLLRWWSIRTLGVHFTFVIKTSTDQAVIDLGPYRFLRHPSYSGVLAAFLGCALMLGNWVGAIASILLLFGGLLYRLLREEQVMVAAFGDTYVDYAKRRARLIPFLW